MVSLMYHKLEFTFVESCVDFEVAQFYPHTHGSEISIPEILTLTTKITALTGTRQCHSYLKAVSATHVTFNKSDNSESIT